MRTLFEKRPFLVWLLLSAITVTYLGIDRLSDDRSAAARTAVTASAVALALIKVRIIMREFMEVRRAPAWLRRLTDLAVGLMALSLFGAYFVGRSVA